MKLFQAILFFTFVELNLVSDLYCIILDVCDEKTHGNHHKDFKVDSLVKRKKWCCLFVVKVYLSIRGDF